MGPRIKPTLKANRERAVRIFERLRGTYPDAGCTLGSRSPLQILIATILAAQCTDKRVNIVTKTLFRKYANAQDYVNASRSELEQEIRSCGFYRQKARGIVNTCTRLAECHGGEVPGTMEELLALDGVGRKTANVVLGECFGVPGVIVDTHCKRLSARLGFTKNDEPVKIERDLMRILPRETWTLFSHCLVFHGRAVCHARKPECKACAISSLCPYPGGRAGKRR